jgi:hypothetical protein
MRVSAFCLIWPTKNDPAECPVPMGRVMAAVRVLASSSPGLQPVSEKGNSLPHARYPRRVNVALGHVSGGNSTQAKRLCVSAQPRTTKCTHYYGRGLGIPGNGRMEKGDTPAHGLAASSKHPGTHGIPRDGCRIDQGDQDDAPHALNVRMISATCSASPTLPGNTTNGMPGQRLSRAPVPRPGLPAT